MSSPLCPCPFISNRSRPHHHHLPLPPSRGQSHSLVPPPVHCPQCGIKKCDDVSACPKCCFTASRGPREKTSITLVALLPDPRGPASPWAMAHLPACPPAQSAQSAHRTPVVGLPSILPGASQGLAPHAVPLTGTLFPQLFPWPVSCHPSDSLAATGPFSPFPGTFCVPF